MLTIFTEDTFAVLGFILFAALVYNLLGIVLKRYFGKGRTRTIHDRLASGEIRRDSENGKKGLLRRLSRSDQAKVTDSRKDDSGNVSDNVSFPPGKS